MKLQHSAEMDLSVGSDFYERQGGEALARYFLESVITDLESLADLGGIHRKFSGYHRMIARKFPFAIYYRLDGDEVVVWRVLDCRRHPGAIRKELDDEN